MYVCATMLEPPAARHPIPFYGSYASFYRAINALKNNGLPRRIETRTLAHILETAEAPRIVSGFASLGWIDESGHPSDDLRNLVDAFGEDSWKATIADVLPRTYSFIIPENWGELTPDRLRDALVSYTGSKAEALQSAETFFLCLAYEGGFQLSEAFYRRAARAITDAKRFALLGQSGSLRREPAKTGVSSDVTDGTLKMSDLVRQILDLAALIDEEDITDREKNAILILLSYLRRREQRERQ